MEIDNDFIIDLRKSIGLTQRAFAELLGVSFFTIRNLEQKQTSVPKSVINAVLTKFPEYINKDIKEKDSNIVPIPFYRIKAAAGKGVEPVEYEEKDVIHFDKRWLENVLNVQPNNLSLVQAKGDSMLPTIQDGDLLMVDSSQLNIINNKIYVIRQNNTLRVKRLKREITGEVKVISDNEKYPVETVNRQTEIIGQVVWNGSKGYV